MKNQIHKNCNVNFLNLIFHPSVFRGLKENTMKKEGYYSTGEFMKQANITKKTIRYYDEKNILKPSFVSDSGARYYTEKDLAKLQQILLLKYLGFSLGDIKEMQVDDADKHFIVNSLNSYNWSQARFGRQPMICRQTGK